MEISERKTGNVLILDVNGKILLGEGSTQLRAAVEKAIAAGNRNLLLNLAEVPFMDSAGLGEVVRCYTTMSREGGKLKLLNMTKRIQDLMVITKLITVLDHYESEPEAVASFA